MLINPLVSGAQHNAAAVEIDEALQALQVEPERLSRMKLLGGLHQPPGGPPVAHLQEAVAYLADGLAGAFEVIAAQQERIEELEKADTSKAAGAKKK